MKSNTMRFAVKLVLEIILIVLVCLMFSSAPSSAEESDDTFEHTFIHNYDGAGDCVICHRDIAENITTSVHNTWMGEDTGKLAGVNDFCGAVQSNEQLCGKCHGGFGLPTYDFSTEKVDCLICHAPNYKKTATGPNPNNDMDEVMSRITGEPTREYCLRCHATAGGGNNRKRGDLELAMGAPIVSPDLDVHMGDGMLCQDCHTFDGHHVAGQGMDIRVADTEKIVTCDNPDCHGIEPHTNSIYNMHTERLACTTCHVTAYGKLEPVEISRDWENRTLGSNGKYNENIIQASNPAPIHVWWNRLSQITDLTDPVETINGTVTLAEPFGDLNDPNSKIYAARLHEGRQPWDGDFMLPFKVMTVKTTNDMTRAIFDATGNTYDPVEYVDTQRYMGLFHGVSPTENALICTDCHDDHRLDFEALGYDVEKDRTGYVTSATKPGSNVNFAKLSGKDCVSCHQIGGMLPEELQIDVEAMNATDNIHYDLNRGAEDELDSNNVRCWACHGEGDGSEAAQPKGHPEDFKNPKTCNNGDCHTLNQSVFGEPMVSAHFMGADEIDNPGHVMPTTNVGTTVACDSCHQNSVEYTRDHINSPESQVSHYGSTRDLMGYPEFTTTDCVYCHEEHYKGSLNDDIADEWGGATDMMDDEALMVEDDIDKVMVVGDTWELENGYEVRVTAIDLNGNNAHVSLTRYGTVLDDQIINVDMPYEYDHDITVEGHIFEQTDIRINLTGVMRHESGVVAIFEGRSIKRIHQETTNTACYACHMEGYGTNERYTIPDRVGDKTYYTKMLIDFDYYTDNTSKTLKSGDVWDLGDGFTLTVNRIDVDGDLAEIELTRDGLDMESYITHTDETFYYEDDFDVINDSHTFYDLRIFTANVTAIFRSNNVDLITIEDVRLISPDIVAVDIEDTDAYNDFRLDGYNVSQMNIGEDFGGSEPLTLHEASLRNGRDINFADCVQCHDTDSGMDIKRVDAIGSHLGAHIGLNQEASGEMDLTDQIDKACWACHGTGDEPGVHPDKPAKECTDCHVDNVQFGAPDLSEEVHGQIDDCTQCHTRDGDIHLIGAFDPRTPNIINVNVTSVVESGEMVHVSATAVAGWNMKLNDFEYSVNDKYTIKVPGTFDSQIEEFVFDIDTTDLTVGEHRVTMRAMERGEWGSESTVTFTIRAHIDTPEPRIVDEPQRNLGSKVTTTFILIALAHIVGFSIIAWRRRR